MIRFSVCGKTYNRSEPINVYQFLEEMKLSPQRVIVEYNREFLARDLYQKTVIQEGDSLEVVQAFAGG